MNWIKLLTAIACFVCLPITALHAQQVMDPIVVISTFLSGGDPGAPGGGGGGRGFILRAPDPLRTAKENICAATQQVYTGLKCGLKDADAPTDRVELGTSEFSQGNLFLTPVLTLAQTFYSANSPAGLSTARSQAFGQSVDACRGISICVAQVQVFFGANTIALPQSMWGDVNAAANEYMRFIGTATTLTNSPVGKLNDRFYAAKSCQRLKQSGTDQGCTPK